MTQIYSIEQIKRQADLAVAYAGINWEVLDNEPDAVDYFINSLQYGIERLGMVERVYTTRVLRFVDPITHELDTEASKLSIQQADVLAEELHACYSMKGILDTYHAITEITGGTATRKKSPARKKRAPRKRKPKPGEGEA